MGRELRIMDERVKTKRSKLGTDICSNCGKEIKLGVKYWNQYGTKGKVYHESCFSLIS